jgi:hypothetical protein
MVDEIRSGKGTPIVIDRAWFQSRLDTLKGGTADLNLELRVMDRPRSLSFQCDFHRLEGGAQRLVDAVLNR